MHPFFPTFFRYLLFMEKTIFFAPDIATNTTLPADESLHCSRVLRKTVGEEISITNGKGLFFDARISLSHPKHTQVEIIRQIPFQKSWKSHIHIAFAPTKNIDRTEWFLEKATEMGVDQLTLLRTQHSERKEVKIDRLHKILSAAMKQSQKGLLPELHPITSFEQFVQSCKAPYKYIAHCQEDLRKKLFAPLITSGTNLCILIGPEGDFSPKEISFALKHDFTPISLGAGRLRTETAALVACATIHTIEQLSQTK